MKRILIALFMVLLIVANAQAVNHFAGNTNVVGVWNFESGALTTDSQGIQTALTSNGGTIAVSAEPTPGHKQGSNSVQFNTGATYFITDTNLVTGFPLKSGETTKKLTFCGWVYLSQTTNQGDFMSKYKINGNLRSFVIGMAAGGNLQVILGYNAGANAEVWDTTYAMTTGRWYHVGVSFDDSAKSCDVVVYDSSTDTETRISTHTFTNNVAITTGPFALNGELNNTTYVNDQQTAMDEVVIFNTNLSNDDITLIRQASYGPAVPTLTLQAMSDLANTTATGNYTITDTGNQTIDDDGVIISTSNATPTYGGANCTAISGSGAPHQSGAQTSALTGLTASTRYYIVGYAHNASGYGYTSPVSTFQTTPHKYYVKNAGSDSADGYSDASAWATLSKVSGATFVAGDTIYFNRGDRWYEALTLSQSGSSGSPITYTDYGAGNKPIFSNIQVLASGSWEGGPVIWTRSFAVCNWLWEDDLAMPKASDATLANGNWYADGATIYYKTSDGSTPATNGKTVTRSTASGSILFGSTVTYNTFNNIKFIGHGTYITGTKHVENFIFSNCDFTDCMTSLALTALNGNSSINITSCTFNRCANPIYLDVSSSYLWTATITNNNLTNINLVYPTSANTAGTWPLGTDISAIETQNQLNCNVSNNIINTGITGGGGGGLICWSNTNSATNNVWNANYLNGLTGRGIVNGGSGISGATYRITNNIVANCGTGASPPYGGIKVDKAQTNGYIANNTIYNCDIGLYMLGQATGYNIENNIFLDNTLHVYTLLDPAGTSSLIDYCCFYPNDGTRFKVYGDSAKNYADFNTFYSGWSWDAHSFVADPLFKNTSGLYNTATDFKLQATSPCINAGDNSLVSTVTTDYEGTTRPK